jgi:hypothetical protein
VKRYSGIGMAEVKLHSFSISELDKAICQPYELRALHPDKEYVVPTGKESCLGPKIIWTFWRREKSLDPAGYAPFILVTV